MTVSTEVVVAAFSLFGTLAGTFGGIMAGNKLTNYKLDELKKQVEKHNSLIDRMYRVEMRVTVIEDALQAAHAKG